MFIRTCENNIINVDKVSRFYKVSERYSDNYIIKAIINEEKFTICKGLPEYINEQYEILLEGISKNASLIDFSGE